MKMFLGTAALILVAGCASSGPVPIGQDTYMISKTSAGGIFVSASSIKIEVIKEAYAFCNSEGKKFQMVSTDEKSAIPAARMPSAEVQFMCLNAGDPMLTRTVMHRAPDQIIEIRK